MRILWIALVWPEPGSSAAGFRTAQLIEILRNGGHQVQVSSPCRANQHQDRLTSAGIRTVSYKPNDSAFDDYLGSYNPEAVFFDRFMAEEQFGWRVKQHCPNALRILDTVDLHFLRRARQRKVEEPDAASQTPVALAPRELLTDDAIREISSIYRSDLSLVISEAELALLEDHYKVPPELLTVCKFFYPAPQSFLEFESRRHFVSIGNFHHEPNADSFRLLRQTLWKRICEKLREPCELHIYGAYPTKEFTVLDDSKAGFRVNGWADDALATLEQYRVNLAPLRFGAGLKGKISDGWAAGTPCVATSVGAEGMYQSLPFGGFVEDDWDRFAEKAAELYSNREIWHSCQSAGAGIVAGQFNAESNSAKFLHDFEALIKTRDAGRLRNFIGATLWHQQHRSTEFFSRWIEEKNRIRD